MATECGGSINCAVILFASAVRVCTYHCGCRAGFSLTDKSAGCGFTQRSARRVGPTLDRVYRCGFSPWFWSTVRSRILETYWDSSGHLGWKRRWFGGRWTSSDFRHRRGDRLVEKTAVGALAFIVRIIVLQIVPYAIFLSYFAMTLDQMERLDGTGIDTHEFIVDTGGIVDRKKISIHSNVSDLGMASTGGCFAGIRFGNRNSRPGFACAGHAAMRQC